MHYNNGYPSELHFYKYFANNPDADFDMRVEVGSGEHYQTVGVLTKADGGQVGSDDEWSEHLIVLDSVDEVAYLRFTVTHQYGNIDPSIDDINIFFGRPDLALDSIISPTIDSCLDVYSTVRPVIKIRNTGHFPVDDFDVRFLVGSGSDTLSSTEHINHHLEPGESITYTSTHEFVVSTSFFHWDVLATVIVPNDGNYYNDSRRELFCTNVGVPEYESKDGVWLGQNEPNPAVMSTQIPYAVPEPGQISLEVTNTAGQVFYTTKQEADLGTNYIELNTSNFAAGVYYYTLYYKNVVLTKKMVIKK